MVGGVAASGSVWAECKYRGFCTLGEFMSQCAEAEQRSRKGAENLPSAEQFDENGYYIEQAEPQVSIKHNNYSCTYTHYWINDEGWGPRHIGNIGVGGSTTRFKAGFSAKPLPVYRDLDCSKEANTDNPVNIGTGSKVFKYNLYQGQYIDLSLTYDSKDGLWLDNLNVSAGQLIALKRADGELVNWDGHGSLEIVQNRRKYIFNKQLHILSISDLSGKELLRFQYYDNSVDIIASSEKITLRRDPETSQLLSAELPTNKKILLSYDSEMRLVSIDDSGKKVQYLYEDQDHPRAITKVIGSDGKIYKEITYHKDTGFVKSSSLASLDEIMTFEYPYSNLRKVTNEWGKKTDYRFIKINGMNRIQSIHGFASKNCLASNKRYEYEQKTGLLKSKTDWKGNTTTYEYYPNTLLKKKTEAANTDKKKETRYVWDSKHQLVLKKNETSGEFFSWDQNGNLVKQETFSKTDLDSKPTIALDAVLNELAPSRHFVMSDLDTVTGKIPNRANGLEGQLVLMDNENFSDIQVQSVNSVVSEKYIDLNGSAYLEMGSFEYSKEFTWVTWVEFNSLDACQNIFNASDSIAPKNVSNHITLSKQCRSSYAAPSILTNGKALFKAPHMGLLRKEEGMFIAFIYKDGIYKIYSQSKSIQTDKFNKIERTVIPEANFRFFSIGRGVDGQDEWEQSGDFKVGRIATFDRALTEEEIRSLYQASQQ